DEPRQSRDHRGPGGSERGRDEDLSRLEAGQVGRFANESGAADRGAGARGLAVEAFALLEPGAQQRGWPGASREVGQEVSELGREWLCGSADLLPRTVEAAHARGDVLG